MLWLVPAIATPAKSVSNADGHVYEAGTLVAGKYRLDSLLGEGGMGAVWAARNMTLHVNVALKLIRRDVASEEASLRLLQEARAAAQLDHPSIVRVMDFGETAHGDPFFVMELLAGDSLQDDLDERGKFPPVEAVQMLLPVISGLAAAHLKGIVHRDLKPDNVILVKNVDGDITPKLVDFGVAKLNYKTIETSDVAGPHADALPTKLTRMGSIVGSPHYMSPEQARCDTQIDGRADVWGACVLLYEMIHGRPPFERKRLEDLVMALITDAPASLYDSGECGRPLWDIIAKGLEKRRSDRWPDARQLGIALANWALDCGADVDVTGRSLTKHWLSDPRPSSPSLVPRSERETLPPSGPSSSPSAAATAEAPSGVSDGAIAHSRISDSGTADGRISDSGIADSGIADSGIADSGIAAGRISDGRISDGGTADGRMTDTGTRRRSRATTALGVGIAAIATLGTAAVVYALSGSDPAPQATTAPAADDVTAQSHSAPQRHSAPPVPTASPQESLEAPSTVGEPAPAKTGYASAPSAARALAGTGPPSPRHLPPVTPPSPPTNGSKRKLTKRIEAGF